MNDLFTRAYYDFAKARRNKDAITRFIEAVLDDYYSGPNPQARKAGGIQYARAFPVPSGVQWNEPTVNLFDVEDRFKDYFYRMEATIKILEAKAGAKITNNSMLKIDRSVVA